VPAVEQSSAGGRRHGRREHPLHPTRTVDGGGNNFITAYAGAFADVAARGPVSTITALSTS
jgi:hypothetical protein